MPKSVNEVRIGGHCGKDAQRYGNGPYKFSVATGGGKKKDGGNWPTHWHTIVVWPNRVEGAEYVRKGLFVEVEGRLEYEKWTDKNTGQERTQAVIVATSLVCDGGQMEQPQQQPLTPRYESAPAISDEDIPF